MLPTDMPRLKGFRHPREVIAYAVWAYHRLALSTSDVEDLLAARGVIVSREAIFGFVLWGEPILLLAAVGTVLVVVGAPLATRDR